MADRISQSVAKRVPLKAYLASDHLSAATGKTIAVVISKNGAAFGNPNAGATNATEIASGWYYVDLDTTDTATAGPLIVRGTAGTIDDVEIEFSVEGAIPANVTQFGGSAGTFASGVPEVKAASLGTTAKADVNAEVVDCLNTDTYGEPGQENPPATTTLVKKIGYLYKVKRNRKVQTATQFSLYADNGTTIDQKATISDDSVTTDFGELGTGP